MKIEYSKLIVHGFFLSNNQKHIYLPEMKNQKESVKKNVYENE